MAEKLWSWQNFWSMTEKYKSKNKSWCGLTIHFEKSAVFLQQKVRTSAFEALPTPLILSGQPSLDCGHIFEQPIRSYCCVNWGFRLMQSFQFLFRCRFSS